MNGPERPREARVSTDLGTTPAVSATRLIKEKALALGFDAVGIAGLEPLEAREHFEARIAAERHGTMSWLARARSRERRAGPARILPGIASVVERGFAERAGFGWAGKHAGVLSTTLRSWFLLGEVLVDRALEPDPPASEHCGTCVRCIEACPRNRFAPPAREARLHARSLEGWSLERFLTLEDNTFMRLFEGSPIRRARRAGFLRNVCVALGNRRDAAAALERIGCEGGD